MLIVHFHAEESERELAQFLHNHNAVNLIHENTCKTSTSNPGCIDLIIPNSPDSCQNM